MCIALGCGDSTDGADGTTGVDPPATNPDTWISGPPQTSSSGSTTFPFPDPSGGGPTGPQQTGNCKRYLECATELAVEGLDDLVVQYGPDGTCWDFGADEASACNQTCQVELGALAQMLEDAGEVVPPACEPPPQVGFAVIAQIIDDNCVAACHELGGEYDELLLAPDPYGEIVGGFSTQSSLRLIEPGDHQSSYLWHKVAGSHGSAGGSGARMPKGGPALSPGDIDDLANWIDGGATP
jgi:hypothetical protein